MRRKRLEVASPWRRLGAAMIDVAIFLPLIGLAVFGWFKLRRPSRHDPPRPPRPPDESSRRVRLTMGAVGTAGAIGFRNGRSPGARLLGIRTVDARTGGPVSVRSVVIHQLVTHLSSSLSRELVRPLQKRESDRLRDLRPAMDEIRREHAGDTDAKNAAMMRLYTEHDVNQFRTCLWPLLSAIVVQLPSFLTPRGQTLAEWLAGTIVIRN